MRGRFVVGRDATDTNSEYSKAGTKGGARSVQLTENQIPRHSHGVSLNTNTQGQHSHPYVDVLFPVEESITEWPVYLFHKIYEIYNIFEGSKKIKK